VTRLLGIVAIYAVMFVAWIGAGMFLLLAPVAAGNLIHESFGLFPQVGRADRGKKLILRLAGAGFLAFAARFAFRIAQLAGDGQT